MLRCYGLPTLLLALVFSVACASARRTGSTVKDATVAAGEKVGDKTEDAVEKVKEKTADATITSAVKMKLAKDKTVSAHNIDVDTKDGNVTLTGSVKTQTEADQAVVLAKSVEGVKSVTPHLTLKNP
jgi:hyperosmotically inducible periplasmic protein